MKQRKIRFYFFNRRRGRLIEVMARLHALVNAGGGRYLLCVLRHNKRKAQKAGLLIKGLMKRHLVTWVLSSFSALYLI